MGGNTLPAKLPFTVLSCPALDNVNPIKEHQSMSQNGGVRAM